MPHCNEVQLVQGLRSFFASLNVPSSLSTCAFVDSGWSSICKIYNQWLWCWTDVWCQHSAIQENTLSPLGCNVVFLSLLNAHYYVTKQFSQFPGFVFERKSFNQSLFQVETWFGIISLTSLNHQAESKLVHSSFTQLLSCHSSKSTKF